MYGMSEVRGTDLVEALRQKRLAAVGSPTMMSIQPVELGKNSLRVMRGSGARRRRVEEGSRRVRQNWHQKRRAFSVRRGPQRGGRQILFGTADNIRGGAGAIDGHAGDLGDDAIEAFAAGSEVRAGGDLGDFGALEEIRGHGGLNQGAEGFTVGVHDFSDGGGFGGGSAFFVGFGNEGERGVGDESIGEFDGADAEDHGIFVAALAVDGGPEAAGDEGAAFGGGGHMPEEIVAKVGERLGGIEFFPGGGVNVLIDALDIEETFGGDEVVGFDAEIIHVVVPARMFAEGGEIDFGSGFGGAKHAGEIFQEGGQKNSISQTGVWYCVER